jgi:hypothetical protein
MFSPVGQKIDQEAKEKLISLTATNIDHAHFVQEMSHYCFWSRYLAVTALFLDHRQPRCFHGRGA